MDGFRLCVCGGIRMCIYCEDIKRRHPKYIFCPMCGKNFNGKFVPNYIMERKVPIDRCGRQNGLSTDTLVRIKQ